MFKKLLILTTFSVFIVADPEGLQIDTSQGQSTQTGGENGGHQG